MGGQVVDTGTAAEFMEQVLQKVSIEEMRDIAAALERKAARFDELFGDAVSAPPDEAAIRTGLSMMFGARRKADAMIASAGAEAIGERIGDLLKPGELLGRYNRFVAAFPDLPDVAADVAGEILHFTRPDSHWLWTRWMWDPRTETGALRLVTMDEVELSGATPGETYLMVGEAVAFVAETARAVGFMPHAPGTLGLDVFLACVYGIYMYTVLRMRMTQEFNHVVPELPELARRLLGVWRIEPAAGSR